MHFSTAAALMLSSVCSAAVLPRETASSEPKPSEKFIIHSKPKGAENFDKSLGYIWAEYSYPPGYYATLRTDKSDALPGVLSDVNDAENASLNFPNGDFPQGFKVSEQSEQYPSSIAEIYSGQEGTAGMTIEDGLLKWTSPNDNVPTSWFACENWALRWGPATALFNKWENATTTEGCVDVDLVVEYVVGHDRQT
ncbi:hypothetical protein Q7P37_007468 [Cladosporium fusiforme]